MGSLVYSAIAKGLGDLGTVIGSGMQKSAEMQWQALRDDEKEARSLMKAKELKRFEEDLKEEAAKRDADIYSQAVTKGAEAGKAREAAQLETESGALAGVSSQVKGNAPSMTQDEMKQHLARLSPSERDALAKTGLVGEAMSATRKEMQGYDDTENAARELGASSTLMKSLQDAKKARLDQIRFEFANKKEENRVEEERRREDRRDREFQALLPVKQQTADAATTRANRPAGSGGSGSGSSGEGITLRGLQAEATAAARAVDAARKSRDTQQKAVDGAYGANKATAQAALDAANDNLRKAEAAAEQSRQAIARFNTGRSGGSAAKPSDNGNVKRDYSNLWNK